MCTVNNHVTRSTIVSIVIIITVIGHINNSDYTTNHYHCYVCHLYLHHHCHYNVRVIVCTRYLMINFFVCCAHCVLLCSITFFQSLRYFVVMLDYYVVQVYATLLQERLVVLSLVGTAVVVVVVIDTSTLVFIVTPLTNVSITLVQIHCHC